MTKRPSIADLAPRKSANAPAPAESAQQPAAPQSREQPGTKPPAASYKAVLAKVDEETHRALKILSANEDTPIGDLLVEGLNLLFRSRNLPEIATKVTPEEQGKPRR